jgi:hypothetical protein
MISIIIPTLNEEKTIEKSLDFHILKKWKPIPRQARDKKVSATHFIVNKRYQKRSGSL